MDCKLVIDDNAAYRQRELFNLQDKEQEDQMEVRAAKADLNYIHLTGNIGCMGEYCSVSLFRIQIASQSTAPVSPWRHLTLSNCTAAIRLTSLTSAVAPPSSRFERHSLMTSKRILGKRGVSHNHCRRKGHCHFGEYLRRHYAL